MKKSLNLLLVLVSAICMISCDSDDGNNDGKDANCSKSFCEGNTANTCKDGKLINKQTCKNGCNDGVCNSEHQQESCTENALKCDEAGVPQKCVEKTWIAQDACKEGQHCSEGSCVDGEAPVKKCEDGKLQCSSDGIPQKCVSNEWVNQTACTGDKKCVQGECKAESKDKTLCEGIKCGETETCTNGVCVPNDMLKAKEGDPCDESWEAEYCNADGNAVYCMLGDNNKTNIFIEKCSGNCKVGYYDEDFQNNTFRSYFSSCVDPKLAEKCKNPQENLLYCAEFEDGSYKSSYECVSAIGGGLTVIDGMAYGIAVKCQSGCNSDNTTCEGMCKTDADCSGSTPYCDEISGACSECIKYEANKKCKDSTKVCVLNNDDQYYCEDAETAGCKPEKCAATVDEDYTGNVCVEIFNSLECGCESQNDCREGYTCDNDWGVCLENSEVDFCTKDSDCDEDYPFCDVKTGFCVECSKDSDCDSETPYCDVDWGVCLECKMDSDCKGDRPYCDEEVGWCAECILDDPDRKCKDSNKTCKEKDFVFVCE